MKKDWFAPCTNPPICLPAARALAQDIAANAAPVSVALTRQMLWRMAGADHPMEAHRADSRAIQARGAIGRRKRGRHVVPGKATCGFSRSRIGRYSEHLAALERAGVQLNARFQLLARPS